MSQKVSLRTRLLTAAVVCTLAGAGAAHAGGNDRFGGPSFRSGSNGVQFNGGNRGRGKGVKIDRKVSCGGRGGPFCAPEVGVEGAAPAFALVLGAIAVMGASRRRRRA